MQCTVDVEFSHYKFSLLIFISYILTRTYVRAGNAAELKQVVLVGTVPSQAKLTDAILFYSIPAWLQII